MRFLIIILFILGIYFLVLPDYGLNLVAVILLTLCWALSDREKKLDNEESNSVSVNSSRVVDRPK